MMMARLDLIFHPLTVVTVVAHCVEVALFHWQGLIYR